MTAKGARLEGKVALITGAARGIGRAVALRLAEDGADVAAVGVHPDGVEALADEVRAMDRKALAVGADVSSLADLETMAKAVADEFERVDILVCNAGLIRPHPFGQVTEEDWDVSFDVNAKGVFFTMQTVAPLIPDGGTIINISSVAGRGTPDGIATLRGQQGRCHQRHPERRQGPGGPQDPRQRRLPRLRPDRLPGGLGQEARPGDAGAGVRRAAQALDVRKPAGQLRYGR